MSSRGALTVEGPAGEGRAAQKANSALNGRTRSVRLLGNQPPALFREAGAMDAFQLDPALIDGVEDRGSGRAGDAR